VGEGRFDHTHATQGLVVSGTRWARLAGDTSRFAIELALGPEEIPGEVAPDEAASWGSLKIWIAGSNVCAAQVRGQRLEAAHWYLLPVAEWLIHNWDPVFHEERLPCRSEGPAAWGAWRCAAQAEVRADVTRSVDDFERTRRWFQRHALRGSAPEALLPDVFFRRIGENVEISMTRRAPPGGDWGMVFDPVPARTVSLSDVAEPMAEAVEALADRLLREHPGSVRLRQLLADVRGLRDGTRRSRRFEWLSGAGEDVDGFLRLWRDVEAAVPSDLALLFGDGAGHAGQAQELIMKSTPLSLLMSYGQCVSEDSWAPSLA
jgi:hypothetical protein